MIPTSIIDNFFESPQLIRDYALSLEFSKIYGNYPGVRTNQISDINNQLFNLILKKIHSAFFGSSDKIGIVCDSYFQLIDSSFEGGWFHQDTDYHIAGVIYLNPEAPLNGGTIIGQNAKPFDAEKYKFRDDFYKNKDIDLTSYRQIKDGFNDCFNETLIVNNIFNRALIYDSKKFHRENKFFGKTKEDSRLTLIFFIRFVMEDSFPPMIRCNL
jgi:hypothetical protein